MHINVTAICQFYWEHFFCEKINLICSKQIFGSWGGNIFLERTNPIFVGWNSGYMYFCHATGPLENPLWASSDAPWHHLSSSSSSSSVPTRPSSSSGQPRKRNIRKEIAKQKGRPDTGTRQYVPSKKNWNPSHSTYRKLKTGIFCPSKMCNWYGASSPADHQCIVPERCRALMNGPVLSINRSARPVGAHAKQQPALKYTAHKAKVHKLCITMYFVHSEQSREKTEYWECTQWRRAEWRKALQQQQQWDEMAAGNKNSLWTGD